MIDHGICLQGIARRLEMQMPSELIVYLDTFTQFTISAMLPSRGKHG